MSVVAAAVEMLRYEQKQTPHKQQESVDDIIGGLAFGFPAIAYGG